MATTPKVLGQLNPAANTLTALYTVPAATTATVSSIVMCANNANVFSITVAVGGAADNAKQYLYKDVTSSNNDTFIATIGATLSAGDVIRVKSNQSNTAFTAFGIETT